MTDATLVTILGSFISLLLIVNAYFTRETLARVVRIEIKLESNTTKQHYTEKLASENATEIKKLIERMHTIEGAQSQILSLLEEK